MSCVLVQKCVNVNYLNLLFQRRVFILLQKQSCNYSIDSDSPLEVLKKKVAKNDLIPDEHQLKVAKELQKVYINVKNYVPEKTSLLSKWMGNGKKKKKTPKGLYLYGAVGGGKTMLMDLFYNCCQVSYLLNFYLYCEQETLVHQSFFLSSSRSTFCSPVFFLY